MSKEVKNGKAKLVPGDIIRMGDGRKLSEKFYEHVNIGAYLHNYTGIWTLGLDMLPTTGQRILNLFVYKGCACGMEAWVGFKDSLVPASAGCWCGIWICGMGFGLIKGIRVY
ncbi:unnamed protein product [Meloidogyne enterolobii]|uniref:Uncharacterized protein n=1 Tax=Meloidogyne enterolobii TaxID=390850 RepID=A0ACB0YZI9_MELEN